MRGAIGDVRLNFIFEWLYNILLGEFSYVMIWVLSGKTDKSILKSYF